MKTNPNINWSEIDWSKQDQVIAKELGVGHVTVWRKRKNGNFPKATDLRKVGRKPRTEPFRQLFIKVTQSEFTALEQIGPNATRAGYLIIKSALNKKSK
ncbi:hypothetical protein EBZ80_15815 [bacterium]|nr:hypothetical protein [bacterium]